ncbi:ATP-binding protein [Duganella sp. BuS-21]|uniref:ATP-binding protein n=1 Tax=Duganella sp. BuS-21 TaxID=2943848 RepID=UPI0035A680BF
MSSLAEAVTEFGYQQALATAERFAEESNERAGFFAHELRNILGTASLAFSAAKAGNIEIEVSDNCGGLPQNAEATMFLPFSQHGTERSGLGLGLTIAQQSVIACGGILSVRNIPQRGCVFSVRMPRGSMPQ